MREGIITFYKGRRYRSRLEARWASFFDLAGWRYEYEPYDLPGWIPDFLLLGCQKTLVEVKPYTTFGEFDLKKIIQAMDAYPESPREVLLVGASLFDSFADGPWPDGIVVGWLGEVLKGHGGNRLIDLEFDEAILCESAFGLGFFHASGSWTDRMSGMDHRQHWVASKDKIAPLWQQSGNIAQWEPHPYLDRT